MATTTRRADTFTADGRPSDDDARTFRAMMSGQDAPSPFCSHTDRDCEHGSGGGAMSLRETLVGMIEEYARHMGHVDLLRERIDGRLGQ